MTQDVKAQLTKGQAFELDPQKAYIIFLKSTIVSQEQGRELKQKLADIGVENVVIVLTEKGSYKIVEATVAEAKLKKQAIRQAKAEVKKK